VAKFAGQAGILAKATSRSVEEAKASVDKIAGLMLVWATDYSESCSRIRPGLFGIALWVGSRVR
jgi:hypothetical protein